MKYTMYCHFSVWCLRITLTWAVYFYFSSNVSTLVLFFNKNIIFFKTIAKSFGFDPKVTNWANLFRYLFLWRWCVYLIANDQADFMFLFLFLCWVFFFSRSWVLFVFVNYLLFCLCLLPCSGTRHHCAGI